MATRSTITVRTGENERKSVYCHWDGYPSYNGLMLFQHYNDLEKAKELVELGDISTLKKNIHQSDKTSDWKVMVWKNAERVEEYTSKRHSFDNQHIDVTVFYGRDRGETGVECAVLRNVDKVNKQDYNYYFDGKEWFVGKRKLKDELIRLGCIPA